MTKQIMKIKKLNRATKYDMDERYNILCACVGQLIQSRLKNNIPMRTDIIGIIQAVSF